MSAIASRITGVSVVYSTICSGTVDSPHKGSVTQKKFPFDDVITMRIHTCCSEQRLRLIDKPAIYQCLTVSLSFAPVVGHAGCDMARCQAFRTVSVTHFRAEVWCIFFVNSVNRWLSANGKAVETLVCMCASNGVTAFLGATEGAQRTESLKEKEHPTPALSYRYDIHVKCAHRYDIYMSNAHIDMIYMSKAYIDMIYMSDAHIDIIYLSNGHIDVIICSTCEMCMN